VAVEVTLDPHEAILVTNVALTRYASAMNNRQMKGLAAQNPWERICMDVEGAASEYAVAKLLRLPWSGNASKGVDIEPNIDVKSTKHESGRLLVTPDAEDDWKFVLVTGAMPTYKVIGWMWGRDAKREEWLTVLDPRRPACYAVPQDKLKSFVKV